MQIDQDTSFHIGIRNKYNPLIGERMAEQVIKTQHRIGGIRCPNSEKTMGWCVGATCSEVVSLNRVEVFLGGNPAKPLPAR